METLIDINSTNALSAASEIGDTAESISKLGKGMPSLVKAIQKFDGVSDNATTKLKDTLLLLAFIVFTYV